MTSYNSDQHFSRATTMNSFMCKVYGWMGGAFALTAGAAYGVYQHAPLFNFIMQKYVFFGLIIAELVLVWRLSARIHKMSFRLAAAAYVAYALLTGVTLSVIFAVYQLPSIVSILLVSVAMFIGMALYGYYTKADLTTIGNVLLMGLFGIVIAGIVNVFFHNATVDFVCAALGVMIFTGLIAYDTQKLKDLGGKMVERGQPINKIALMGALELYLDFVNLFLDLLRLFGKKK
ncbi:MAG: Bax inhibitor-1/YccA family protein [Candidatus Babeliales bacterium]